MSSLKQTQSGVQYFLKGISLALTPGIRRFVFIPLLINFVLLGGSFFYLYNQIGGWIDQILDQIPSWLDWISYLLWPLIVISILAVFSYFFSTLANWIAAPFNGLLAEHLEAKLTNQPAPNGGVIDALKDLPRIFKREWQKLKYYLPKALGLFILFFIPAIGQSVAPILWFLFTAWMMAIQYCDYPFDNHKVPFEVMRDDLKTKRGKCLSFGSLVTLFTMTPILNLFVMPIAVCGATAMWVDVYRDKHSNS
ncbi:sulfate transporter CysZ [Aliivibrio sp. 1S128]|uniref:sulfate transporter CysZ n=1 Tax=Aliivibrio sp. 1S128 TaxID=1840085 RepID=UPI00080EE6FF|nr:sulfate transporter CysZ [Aliivibrio sp. 1S128]OCH24152.1 sulfate transporter CysZ [Aliivibrio sp. 1S128]